MAFEKIYTPKVRVAFSNLLKPRDRKDKDPMFGCCLIFDEEAQATDEYKAMKDAASQAAKDKWGDKIPKKLNSPFKPAEDFVSSETEERFDGFDDGFVGVNVVSKNKPGIVFDDPSVGGLVRIDTPEEVYSGMYVIATVNAFWYDQDGNKGVSFGLQNLMKVEDGDRLGGGPSKPEDDFADYASAAASDGDDGADLF